MLVAVSAGAWSMLVVTLSSGSFSICQA